LGLKGFVVVAISVSSIYISARETIFCVGRLISSTSLHHVMIFLSWSCCILLSILIGTLGLIQLLNISAIPKQIAFVSVVYPALVLAYMGQAAFISQHHNFESSYHIGFYVSVPGIFFHLYLFW
jgi:hypothetical protein